MKKLTVFLYTTIIILSFYRNMEQNKDISLKVKEEVVTTDTAVITLIHENHSKKRYYMYDASHQLEKEVDGVWCEIPFRSDHNIAFGQSGIILPPKNEKMRILMQ